MEEGRSSGSKSSSRPSSPQSPKSPRTRKMTDASLRRLRSGTTLQEAADDRLDPGVGAAPWSEPSHSRRPSSAGRGRASSSARPPGSAKASPPDRLAGPVESATLDTPPEDPSAAPGVTEEEVAGDPASALQAHPPATHQDPSSPPAEVLESHGRAVLAQESVMPDGMGIGLAEQVPQPQETATAAAPAAGAHLKLGPLEPGAEVSGNPAQPGQGAGGVGAAALRGAREVEQSEGSVFDGGGSMGGVSGLPPGGASMEGFRDTGASRPVAERASGRGRGRGRGRGGRLRPAGERGESWEAEEKVIAQAKKIREKRNHRALIPAPEPKRGKLHWDFLLEEMQWMAKEFARERKWKIAQAKKFVKRAAASESNLALRDGVREREEAIKIRKRAAWIGKEVMKFWGKAERVVAYKNKSAADARKKEVMDKHLNFLVGQTQRYSSMLAQRLTAGSEAPQEEQGVEEPLHGGEGKGEEAKGDPGLNEPPSTAHAATAQPEASGAAPKLEADVEPAPQSPRSTGGEAASLASEADMDDPEDFQASQSESDDEATMIEEEEMARDEEDDTANEMQDLEAEAELPLEVLMARYGYQAGTGDATPPGPPATPPDPPADTVASEEHDAPAGEADTTSVGGPSGSPQEIGAAGDAIKVGGSGMGDLGDDEEYQEVGLEEEDDEATLDQEDEMAANDGGDAKAREAEEVDALGKEAEMPLEQLLAMYKAMAANGDAGSEDDSDDATAMHVDSPIAAEESKDVSWAHMLAEGPVLPAEAPSQPAAGPSEPAAEAKLTSQGLKQEDGGLPSTEPVVAARPEPAPALKGEGGPGERRVEGEEEGGEEDNLEDAAARAQEAQPKGTTFETANVQTKAPFLLKHTMREYQHIGLDWLMTIYTRRLNGILADEMGLGKTIQTIALLAHLACEKGIWGPHLIVVPTSVMLNWEMELKKWCPAFKLLTYYGSVKERKLKRQGWSKPNAFHVCITSYTLVLQDAKMFRRKKWKYLILDEAHMIKNWKSQRWQTLLNFNSARRLLITGTPLQNDLMELWSLMHFLMPQVFASHAQFKDWFSNPLTNMVEGSENVNKVLVERLHSVLRPFLLRRLKSQVEKQMPGKHEHVIRCRLSRRQRSLYEDYMASSDTRNTLSSGNFLGIINVLMSLRKVCNHPDLFEGRPIVSAFDTAGIQVQLPTAAVRALERDVWGAVDLAGLSLLPAGNERMARWEAECIQALEPGRALIQELPPPASTPWAYDLPFQGVALEASLQFRPSAAALGVVQRFREHVAGEAAREATEVTARNAGINGQRCGQTPLFGTDCCRCVHVPRPSTEVRVASADPSRFLEFSNALRDAVVLPGERVDHMEEELKTFVFAIPKARAPAPKIWCTQPDLSLVQELESSTALVTREFQARSQPLQVPAVRQQLFFPDRRLVQFDCGKLQELALLLQKLKSGGHKALIFTQMTKMLDVLEAFLNLHSYTYLRLDGSTKPEQRQLLMQRFNSNPKIFIFILSTRSGGVGMNLTGADTVIFYDSDWNPAMDAQAQDRCHRIGQTREVHIYRLVSENTIEENILTKSDQKRQLDFLAIQSGGFNPDFLQKFNPKDLLGMQGGGAGPGGMTPEELRQAMRSAEDETDAAAAAAAEEETAQELKEFTTDHGPSAENDEEDADPQGSREQGTEAPDLQPDPAEKPAEDAEEDVLGLANLEGSLRPVERYAVRWLEKVLENQVDAEAEAAKVEMQLGAQEFNMQEIERQQRLQEEEAEEEGEAERMAEWNRGAADAAYKLEIEKAQQQQQLLDEQAAAWAASEAQRMEEYAQRLALQTAMPTSNPSGSKRGRRAWSEEADDAESEPRKGLSWQPSVSKRGRSITRPARIGLMDTFSSSEEEDLDGAPAAKRARNARSRLGPGWGGGAAAGVASAPAWVNGHAPHAAAIQFETPWEQAEDLVLCAVVAWWLPQHNPTPNGTSTGHHPAAQGHNAVVEPSEEVWARVSQALAAGAATLTPAAATAAFQQGPRRTPDKCRQRYGTLLAAKRGTTNGSANHAVALSDLRSGLLGLLASKPALSAQELRRLVTDASARLKAQGSPLSITPAAEAIIAGFGRLGAELSDRQEAPKTERLEIGMVRTAPGEAGHLLDVVKRACGPDAQQLLALLRPLLDTLANGSIQEANAGIMQQMQAATQIHANLSMPIPSPLPHANTTPVSAVGQRATPSYSQGAGQTSGQAQTGSFAVAPSSGVLQHIQQMQSGPLPQVNGGVASVPLSNQGAAPRSLPNPSTQLPHSFPPQASAPASAPAPGGRGRGRGGGRTGRGTGTGRGRGRGRGRQQAGVGVGSSQQQQSQGTQQALQQPLGTTSVPYPTTSLLPGYLPSASQQLQPAFGTAIAGFSAPFAGMGFPMPGMWSGVSNAQTPTPSAAQLQQTANHSQAFLAPMGQAFAPALSEPAPGIANGQQATPSALQEWMAGALQASSQLPLQPFGPPATHPAFPWVSAPGNPSAPLFSSQAPGSVMQQLMASHNPGLAQPSAMPLQQAPFMGPAPFQGSAPLQPGTYQLPRASMPPQPGVFHPLPQPDLGGSGPSG